MPTSILLSVVALLSSYIATLNTTVTYSASPEAPVAVVEELSSEERIVKAIHETFPEDAETALKIAKAESGMNALATNSKDSHKGCTGSFGLFQIACIHGNKDKLYDVDYNIKVAKELYEQNGWQPWGVCHDGKVDCGL